VKKVPLGSFAVGLAEKRAPSNVGRNFGFGVSFYFQSALAFLQVPRRNSFRAFEGLGVRKTIAFWGVICRVGVRKSVYRPTAGLWTDSLSDLWLL